jgi:hypothetical protein
MKRQLLIRKVIQMVVLVTACTLPAVCLAEIPQQQDHVPLLIDGETLKFEILYGSIPAGHAWLEVKNKATGDGDIYRITSRATSNRLVSVFFKVNDTVVSEVDAATFEPRYFEKRLREGPLRRNEIVTYHGDSARSQGETFHIVPGTRDILSALYYIRGRQLSVGEEIPVKTFENGKSYDARVRVLRRERVSTVRGDLDCLVVEPIIDQGIFAKAGRLLIWLTDDALRIPVLMKSKVKIGSFVARLVGSSHSGGSS